MFEEKWTEIENLIGLTHKSLTAHEFAKAKEKANWGKTSKSNMLRDKSVFNNSSFRNLSRSAHSFWLRNTILLSRSLFLLKSDLYWLSSNGRDESVNKLRKSKGEVHVLGTAALTGANVMEAMSRNKGEFS